MKRNPWSHIPKTSRRNRNGKDLGQFSYIGYFLKPLTIVSSFQFVNLAGASKFLVGRDLESCTQQVQCHQFTFRNKDVTLIDVPGFDDTNKSDIEVLTIIADFLATE